MTLPEDPENITFDDLADEFEELWNEVEASKGSDVDFDPDDVIDRAESRASEVAHDSALEGVEHLLDEDCDSERCRALREKLGIGTDEETPEEDAEDADSDESGDADDGESEDVDDDTDTPDSGGPDDGTDGSGDDDDDGGESGDESGVPWEDDENFLGEKV